MTSKPLDVPYNVLHISFFNDQTRSTLYFGVRGYFNNLSSTSIEKWHLGVSSTYSTAKPHSELQTTSPFVSCWVNHTALKTKLVLYVLGEFSFCSLQISMEIDTCAKICIAMSRRVWFPGIFLTMMCNPQWPEINNALLPGQNVVDFLTSLLPCFELSFRHWWPFSLMREVSAQSKLTWVKLRFKKGVSHMHTASHSSNQSPDFNRSSSLLSCRRKFRALLTKLSDRTCLKTTCPTSAKN